MKKDDVKDAIVGTMFMILCVLLYILSALLR